MVSEVRRVLEGDSGHIVHRCIHFKKIHCSIHLQLVHSGECAPKALCQVEINTSIIISSKFKNLFYGEMAQIVASHG